MRPYVIAAILIFLGGICVIASTGGIHDYLSFINPLNRAPYIAGVMLICSGCLCIVLGDLKTAVERKNEDQ